MKKTIVLLFTVSALLFVGCGKSPATKTSKTTVTDWGLIEVAASTPKLLKIEGQDCTFTATPLADGNAAIVIETGNNFGGTGSHGNVSTVQKLNAIVPTGRECITSFGLKPIRFTLKFKPS